MSTFELAPRSVSRITSSKVEHDVSNRTSPQNEEPPRLEPPMRLRAAGGDAVPPSGVARGERGHERLPSASRGSGEGASSTG